MCAQGNLLSSRMRNMWSGQGPAPSLTCPVILILEFWSTGNKSSIAFTFCLKSSLRDTKPPKTFIGKMMVKIFHNFRLARGLYTLPSWGHKALALSLKGPQGAFVVSTESASGSG